MTLEGKNVLKEGWVTLFKSRKPTLFSHKAMVSKMSVFTHKEAYTVWLSQREVEYIVPLHHLKCCVAELLLMVWLTCILQMHGASVKYTRAHP